MKYKLLRITLLSTFAILFAGSALGAFLSAGGDDTAPTADSGFPITATWSFTDPDVVAAVTAISNTTESVQIDNNGLKLTVEANGKTIRDNGNSIQTGDGVVFKVPVQGKKDEVTVVGYAAPYFDYSVGGIDATEATTKYTATATDVAQGYVEVVNKGQYLISISVTQNEDNSGDDEEVATDVTATWDYANPGVMEETLALSGASVAGTVKAVEDNGILMTIEANGATFRNNGNNIQVRSGAVFKVPVKNAGDLVVIKGYPGYSYYKINNGDEITNTNDNPQTEYKAKASDVQTGYVAITSTNDNNYFYAIKVTQYAQKGPATLDNEPATATFPFNLGTDNQTATFTNSDYFLSGKVTYGSNLVLEGLDNKGNGQTWFNPATKESAAKESNAIRFLIQPKFGLSFTPTKVSLKTTRYGTDGGKLDIAWQNADGTATQLATGVAPNRDNATPNVSELSYDITDAVVGEGACGLLINLYSLDNGKRVGFADIVIEGTLSGTEKEVPMLASFTANGVEYAADEVFEADGDQYTATIEVSKADDMISASNPVSNVTALSGEIGEITYNGDETKCIVTIPVALNDIVINYVANFVQKPDFTLTYYNTDGTQMGTQQVEKDATIGAFGVDYTTAKAAAGEKVRGWFKTSVYGEKYTTNEVITSNISLYAVATEIEEASTSKKYLFDLTQKTFYAEDHEAFTPAGEGFYWHDAQHGWAFKSGNTIDLLVGPKATISVGLCRYGYGTAIVVKNADGETLGTLDGMSKTETDGEVVAFNYEGTAGTVTLELQGTGEMYIHNVKIVNTAEVSFESDGQWYYVKAGDASSLIDVLDVVNGVNAQKDAERSFIYLPNGTYDLKQTVLTTISGHNISLIGESQDGVIIKNAPHYTTEGINTTATLMNTGTGNYFQDMTIQNALDYYGSQAAGQNGGRAVALWDKGTNTICKNVTLLSYQDTYYTNNPDGKYYWETSDIHGTVDFICGEGTLFVENSTLTIEKRYLNKDGGCTITAPATKTGNRYGYVFNNCKIENNATNYNLGRAWSNEPRCAYINTTVNDNNIVASRWTAAGMNVPAKEFVEYNTKDANGNVVSPASNIVDFYLGDTHNKMETILTAEQAAEYTAEKVMGEWAPAQLAVQFDAPEGTLKDGTITWSPVEGATAYAIFANGVLLTITDATSYVVEGVQTETEVIYTIRTVNKMGGMGQVARVKDAIVDAISQVNTDNGTAVIYNLQGQRIGKTQKGINIIGNNKVVMK